MTLLQQLHDLLETQWAAGKALGYDDKGNPVFFEDGNPTRFSLYGGIFHIAEQGHTSDCDCAEVEQRTLTLLEAVKPVARERGHRTLDFPATHDEIMDILNTAIERRKVKDALFGMWEKSSGVSEHVVPEHRHN